MNDPKQTIMLKFLGIDIPWFGMSKPVQADAIDDLIESLKEYQRFNTKRNNTEAYLYALGEYALGNLTEKPNAADYGINSKSIA